MKYAYVKNGDVAAQLEKHANSVVKPIRSGPEAFLSEFLWSNPEARILLVSRFYARREYRMRNVEAVTMAESRSHFGKLVLRIFAFPILLSKILRFRPNRILCGSTGSQLWACTIASYLLSVPLVHSRHNRKGGSIDPWYHRFGAKIDRFCLMRANGVICHGPYLRAEMIRIGLDPSRIIEFDVEFSELAAALSDLRQGTASAAKGFNPFILFAGRLEAEKGVLDLVEAMVRLFDDHPEVNLVLAGTGMAEDQIAKFCERHELSARVHLLGYVDRAELASLLSEAVALVTPSKPGFPEGRCMSAMEALVAGTPVIGPRFGPFPYLIKDLENGLLFEPGSVPALSEAISKILTEDSLRDRLRHGARATGLQLQQPPSTFARAVAEAFDGVSPESPPVPATLDSE